MGPAVQDPLAEEGSDPASNFIQSIISTLPGSPTGGTVGRTREAQRQWYESLSEEDQMRVRDSIREEISRIRAQFGKRLAPVSSHAIRLRDYG